MTSTSKSDKSSDKSSDTDVVVGHANVDPSFEGPVATTYEEALEVGYFGGPTDDTDYSVAASAPEPGQQSATTNKQSQQAKSTSG